MNNDDGHPQLRGAKKGRRKTALAGARSTLLSEEDALAKSRGFISTAS